MKTFAGVLLALAVAAQCHGEPPAPQAPGQPAFLAIDSVIPARDSMGRAYLSLSFVMPQDVRVRGSDPRTSSHHGYALFARPKPPAVVWRFIGVSVMQAFSPGKRVGIVADWNTTYGGITAGQVLDAVPTPERLQVLGRYACGDIAASVLVSPTGIVRLNRFVPLAPLRRGPPCLRLPSSEAAAAGLERARTSGARGTRGTARGRALVSDRSSRTSVTRS